MKILVLNAGSSSHKLSLFDLRDDVALAEPLWKGEIDWGREGESPSLTFSTSKGHHAAKSANVEEGIKVLLNSLWEGEGRVIDGPEDIERIGHRVVHGGGELVKPVLINNEVKEAIRKVIPLAPLHNPANLEGIERMEKLFPHIPQVAVFDTAFHATMPDFVKTYPVPLKWKELGVQRYGFHGISHHYCTERAAALLKMEPAALKMINCHLGNGASLCAIKGGKSFDTTMGLTPLEGLMMGSRCGSIDPGILLYLMREHGMGERELDHALNYLSGLKGIAGSSDMREVCAMEGEETGRLALEMYVHRLKCGIGAMATSLEGFEVLCFTGGIGENGDMIRAKVCHGLASFGVVIDEVKNKEIRAQGGEGEISASSSTKKILVVHTREEWMIAKACFR